MALEIFRVKATFCGKDGSMGFKRGKEYLLGIRYFSSFSYMAITIYALITDTNTKPAWCDYSSFFTFFQNWTNIITDIPQS